MADDDLFFHNGSHTPTPEELRDRWRHLERLEVELEVREKHLAKLELKFAKRVTKLERYEARITARGHKDLLDIEKARLAIRYWSQAVVIFMRCATALGGSYLLLRAFEVALNRQVHSVLGLSTLSFLAQDHWREIIYITFGLGGITFGLLERRLKEGTQSDLESMKKELDKLSGFKASDDSPSFDYEPDEEEDQ